MMIIHQNKDKDNFIPKIRKILTSCIKKNTTAVTAVSVIITAACHYGLSFGYHAQIVESRRNSDGAGGKGFGYLGLE